VTDAEPPAGPDDAEAGGGFASLLNTTPKVIGAITALIGAVSGLLIALNKAGLLGDGNGNGNGTSTSKGVKSLFGELTRPIGRVYFDVDGKTMYVRAAMPRTPLLHLADQDKLLQDVAMTTRVRWVSGGTDYGVSLICRHRNARNYYLLGVLSGGRYNIARYRDGRLTSLTRGIQQSSFVNDEANDVVARCVGESPTTLTLEANGHVIAQVTDPQGLPGGNIGIRVGSGESFVTCRFEEFVLKYL
jgi:hypothetical protein